jgi:hypothetical protein
LTKRGVDLGNREQVLAGIDDAVKEIEESLAGQKKTLERDYRKSRRPARIISS